MPPVSKPPSQTQRCKKAAAIHPHPTPERFTLPAHAENRIITAEHLPPLATIDLHLVQLTITNKQLPVADVYSARGKM